MHDDIQSSDPNRPHLHCLECGYDLTGIPEDRCPECGLAEARSRAIAWLTHSNQSLPFGGLPSDGQRKSIWFVSLFQPGELGKRLPPFASETEVIAHLWTMRGLTFAIICISAFVQMGHMSEFFVFGMVFLLSVLVGTALCERISAALMKACARETSSPGPRLWLNLVRCHATFLPLSAILFQIPILSRTFRLWSRMYLGGSSGIGILLLALLPSLLWWDFNLVVGFRARTRPGARSLLLGLLILIGAVISIAVGFVTGVSVGLIIAWILR